MASNESTNMNTENNSRRPIIRRSSSIKFSGRLPVGEQPPVTLAKNGIRHIRHDPTTDTESETLSVGLACSEIFSGPRLARILQPGFEYEQKAMNALLANAHALPLSLHTSGGITHALTDFIDALEPHLPWKTLPTNSNHNSDFTTDDDDWCVSLQMEGASAVSAAIDLLLQRQQIENPSSTRRMMVAVAKRSYHGPPSTSFGAACPLFPKDYQITYPVPVVGDEQTSDPTQLLSSFASFLSKHGDDIGVLLVEPQWGSSQAGLPWTPHVLRSYIRMAQERGIFVIADEIMCGLGRHGQGTTFLSEAWDLNPDAVTFGKAIGGGVYPLSGAILRSGRKSLGCKGKTVMQSHTYSGASVRALMTGREVLNTLPSYYETIAGLGKEMRYIFHYLETITGGMIRANGQGLMWGCYITKKGLHENNEERELTIRCLKRNCNEVGVLPYFVPVGGFMVTPVIDVDLCSVYEIGEKLERALLLTMEERGWTISSCDTDSAMKSSCKEITTLNTVDSALSYSSSECTKCSNYVCQNIRTRFLL